MFRVNEEGKEKRQLFYYGRLFGMVWQHHQIEEQGTQLRITCSEQNSEDHYGNNFDNPVVCLFIIQ